METATRVNKAHTLTIGNKITITGVQNVLVMSEKIVEVALENNVLVLIGLGFSPLHLSVEEGILVLSGSLTQLKYAHTQGKESFWRRLVK